MLVGVGAGAAVGVAVTDGAGVALGAAVMLGTGVGVGSGARSPPCPKTSALTKMARNTPTVSSTKIDDARSLIRSAGSIGIWPWAKIGRAHV